jgi:hypothetical protein
MMLQSKDKLCVKVIKFIGTGILIGLLFLQEVFCELMIQGFFNFVLCVRTMLIRFLKMNAAISIC